MFETLYFLGFMAVICYVLVFAATMAVFTVTEVCSAIRNLFS